MAASAVSSASDLVQHSRHPIHPGVPISSQFKEHSEGRYAPFYVAEEKPVKQGRLFWPFGHHHDDHDWHYHHDIHHDDLHHGFEHGYHHGEEHGFQHGYEHGIQQGMHQGFHQGAAMGIGRPIGPVWG